VEDDVTSAITMSTAGNANPVTAQQTPTRQTADASMAGQSMSRRQRINALFTSPRVHNVFQVQSEATYVMRAANCELDSHADTSVAGPSFVVLEYSDMTCNVSPFAKTYETKTNVPIVKAATAYDDPKTGTTYILVLGQALYFGEDVEASLLCPNMLRANGLIVQDVPVHLSHDGTSSHSIIIPLSLNGCFSSIPTRTPTMEEIETCRWLVLTNDAPWEPSTIPFSDYEEAAIHAQLKGTPMARQLYSIARATPCPLQNISTVYDESEVTRLPIFTISSVKSSTPIAQVNASNLAQRWAIGEKAAANTHKVTTQKGIRNTMFPVERRFRTRQSQLRYPQLNGRHGRFYCDTFFSNAPAVDMSTCCQLFTNDIGFTKVYPMRTKGEAHHALRCFIHDVGIPHVIHSDNAKEQMQGQWRKLCTEFGIPTTFTEPHSPWQNRAEGQIREIKRHIHRKMKARNVPKCLWSYCAKWSSDVRNKTASALFSMEGRTPYEAVYGHTPDISSLCNFDFYEPVWFYEPQTFPDDKRIMARWLGEAHGVGQAMCYWILPANGVPIARSTVQPISKADRDSEEVKSELKELDAAITSKLVSQAEMDESERDVVVIPDYLRHHDDDDDVLTPYFDPIEPEADMPEADAFTHEEYDKYISAEVILPKGDQMILGKVIARKREINDNPIGVAHSNPIFDTRLYQVQFPEGHVEEYSANIIAQNIYSQLDSEGYRYTMMEEITDFKKNDRAVPPEERYVIGPNGNIHKHRTTKGWYLCVMWKDGSTSWEPLKNMKESFPVQVAEFAVSQGLENETAFAWWVKDTLNKKNRIIRAMKTRYARKTHKYGIQLPKSVAEAYEIDKATGTDYWHRAIVKEMTNNEAAFKFLEPGEAVPVGSNWIPCHMVFDATVDLTRKARYVAGGHWTDPPSQITYSTVVSRDSVRIAFLIAALNDIDILCADIGNAYLNAPTKEVVHTTAGPEFGRNRVGQTVLIVRALYGLTSSGAAWHSLLAELIHSMGFTPSLADPDVWYRAATKADGFDYYEYLIVYVDDILVLLHAPKDIMAMLSKLYRLKEEPTLPKSYLGATILEWSIGGEKMWAMSSQNYIKEAIRCLELELAKSGHRLQGKPATPMATGY